MKKSAFVLAVLLAVAPLMAQSHPASHEKKITDTFTFVSDVKVGAVVLTAGNYRIECDHVKMIFTNLDSDKKVEIPCQGPEMAAKSKVTEAYINAEPDGTHRLEKLYLRGSTVEHTFAN